MPRALWLAVTLVFALGAGCSDGPAAHATLDGAVGAFADGGVD